MTTSAPAVIDLVFVGFNRHVAALHRETGAVVWKWRSPKGRGPVALMLDGDRLIAAVNGYTYCLDAETGRRLWQNEMAGFGLGITCLTSFRSSSMATSMLAQHQQQARNQAASAAAT